MLQADSAFVEPSDAGEPEERTNAASACLRTPSVLKTLEMLEQQQPSERRTRLHEIVAQWRSACAATDYYERRKHLRNITHKFNISLTRETSETATTVSKAIGEAIRDRVNALRRWQPSDNAAEDLHAS